MTASQTETAPRPQAEKQDATETQQPSGSVDKTGLRRMLSIEQVLAIVPVSAVTLWRMEKRGAFPRGSFISPNTKIWWADEIAAWQREVDGRRRGQQHHPTPSKS
jgi:predicted DNA-binding transcriptional regulator AlpA